MTQFTFLQLLDETLSRYKQIDESSSSVNEVQPEPSIKHFSGELQHESLRALLYTIFLYKYNKSIDEYETLDGIVSPKIN